MPPFLELCAIYLDCEISDLHRCWDQARLEEKLAEDSLRTTHLKDHNKEFSFGGFTTTCARHTPAYGGKLGISVEQHFFAKHRRALEHPHLPCVIEHGGRGHRNFYPLETVEVVYILYDIL
ncbi:hypothetical protein AAVH_15732 [Aphelenchoides avenae]|nr:hypothetical protein AAVH_15732 [Aphelenchus avenae]